MPSSDQPTSGDLPHDVPPSEDLSQQDHLSHEDHEDLSPEAPAAEDAVELPQAFRVQKLAYFAVPAAFIVAIILAGTSLVWLGWTLIIPILLALWIARIRTVVTEDGITAVGTFRTRRIAWSDIAGLQFSKWGPVRAVLSDGSKVRLPALMFRDLPLLSAASRGRIPDPYAAAAAAES